MKVNNRNGFIEFCRFVFALCVVSHHSIFFEGHGHIPFIGGYIACEFFFILSGFLMAGSISKEENSEESSVLFAVKKIKKIYPYFFVAWITSFIIYHFINGSLQISNVLIDLLRGLPQLFLLSMAGLSGGNLGFYDYVGTGWYSSAYLISILVLYPIMKKCKKIDFWCGSIAPLVTLIGYGYIGYHYGFMGVVNERIPIAYLGCVRALAGISLGCFCYFLVVQCKKYKTTVAGKHIFGGIQLLLLVISLLLMEKYEGFNDIIQLFVFATLIVVTFGFDTYVNELFKNKLSYSLGQFSMVIFVTQSLAYMYPILKYPTDWKMYYITHFIYIFIFSLMNYFIVQAFLFFTKKISIRNLLKKENDTNGKEIEVRDENNRA